MTHYDHWTEAARKAADARMCDDMRAVATETRKGHPGWLAVYDEILALHVKKAEDYGRGADMLANVRASGEFGVPAWLGVAVRMNDKMHRIKSFAQKGVLANESIEDSLLDLANYAMIALTLYREEKAAKG